MPDVSGTVDVEKGLINNLYKYVFSMTKAHILRKSYYFHVLKVSEEKLLGK